MICDLDFYIRQHAAEHPEKTAITFYDQRLTYGELTAGYWTMAQGLARYRLSPGDVVAIICERGPQLILAILAVLKLDCVYLPIDKLNPPQRIEYILSNSGAKLIITDEDLNLNGEWPQADLFSLQASADAMDLCAVSGDENEGFCIMYTSGTTGKPKGAVLPKEGVFNHLQAKIDCTAMDRNSVVAQNAGYYFVNSMWQIFAPLVVGAKMVIYDRHVMNNLEQLTKKMHEDRISIFQAVPTFWSRFFHVVTEGQCGFEDLSCIVSTSEKLTRSLVEKCFQALPHVKLVNAYGQTECSDDVLHFVMEHPPAEEDIPIGFPVPNHRIYIVSDENQICPLGEKGEICVAGIGLSRGYLNAPALTDLAFVKGSKLGLEETLLYRTGDIGYQKEDGTVFYSGRKDYQVKIGGFRVELYEIEKVLLQYPGISQAAVVCTEGEERKKLTAFYSANRAVERVDFHAFLQPILPGYMIPGEYVRLEQFPLTAMEKIDRKKLREQMMSAHP